MARSPHGPAAPAASWVDGTVRSACIDIGSNTTRLLVADCVEGRLHPVAAERAFVALGTALAQQRGHIPAATVAAAAAVAGAQAASARELGALAINAVATAGVRDAANGRELAATVRAAAGVDVRVLSPEDEGCLAFAGATARLATEPEPEPAHDVAVADVGGGSCQLAVGRPGARPHRVGSVPIGSAGLTARAQRDPPSADELARMRAEVAEAMSGLAPAPVPRALVVGGGATSLRRLVGPRFDRGALARALAAITAAPSAEVARRWGLAPERARLLPAAIVILDALAAALDAPLEAADGGLREGVLLESLA